MGLAQPVWVRRVGSESVVVLSLVVLEGGRRVIMSVLVIVAVDTSATRVVMAPGLTWMIRALIFISRSFQLIISHS